MKSGGNMKDKVYVPEGNRLICKPLEVPEEVDKCLTIGKYRLYLSPQIIDGASKLCYRIECDDNSMEDPHWYPIKDWGTPCTVHPWFETGWMDINDTSFTFDLDKVFHLHPNLRPEYGHIFDAMVFYELEDDTYDKRVLMFLLDLEEVVPDDMKCFPSWQVRICDSDKPGVGIYMCSWIWCITADRDRNWDPFKSARVELYAEADRESKYYKFLSMRLRMVNSCDEVGV